VFPGSVVCSWSSLSSSIRAEKWLRVEVGLSQWSLSLMSLACLGALS
jgi:hypothetical protein